MATTCRELFLLPKISILHVEKRPLPWLLSEEVCTPQASYLRNFKNDTPKSPLFVAIKWGALCELKWNIDEIIGNRLTFSRFNCLPVVGLFFCANRSRWNLQYRGSDFAILVAFIWGCLRPTGKNICEIIWAIPPKKLLFVAIKWRAFFVLSDYFLRKRQSFYL